VSRVEPVSYSQYDTKITNNPRRNDYKMIFGEWQWAWGQGFGDFVLKASPLNMARLASAVVNEGRMPYTQYVIVKQERNEKEKDLRKEGFVQLLSPEDASILKNFMKKETENHKTNRARVPTLPSYMGGKTGTAERPLFKPGQRKSNDINDGWYMFFLEGDNAHDPLAVVVRIERGVGSSEAVRLAGNELLGLLEEHGYSRAR
jgi:cell division protein FtsI/penicillin-binding protein 2